MDYLKRYEAGEHEAVWDELRLIGGGLFDTPHLDEAWQIAEVMMARVASNLLRIEAGLRGLGFEFVSVGSPVPDAGAINAAVQASAAEALLSHPGLTAEQAQHLLASLPQLLGGLRGDTFSPAAPNGAQSAAVRPSVLGDPQPFGKEIAAYEKIAGPLPLALAGFWRRFGSVDFTCRLDGELLLAWEPLVVLPPMGLADDHIEWKYDGGEGPYQIELIPDPANDDGFGCPLLGADVTPGADARLETGEWFVDYLRRSIRAACLPGADGAAEAMPGLKALAAQWEPF